MQMNMMTTQTYVRDHQSRLVADARRNPARGRHHDLRRLFTLSRRPSQAADVLPTFAPTSAR